MTVISIQLSVFHRIPPVCTGTGSSHVEGKGFLSYALTLAFCHGVRIPAVIQNEVRNLASLTAFRLVFWQIFQQLC